MRPPTEKQYRTLLALGSGDVLLTGCKREIDAMLRRGWVTADSYSWVRITAVGLHALAEAVAVYGLPEFNSGVQRRIVCGDCGSDRRVCRSCGSRLTRYEYRDIERPVAA